MRVFEAAHESAHQKSVWSEVSSPTTGNCDDAQQKLLWLDGARWSQRDCARYLLLTHKVCALHIANP